MKKLFGILAAVAIVGSVVMTSCSKYEEGPSLSLRSKKARLAGEWSVSNVTLNGTDVTSLFLPSGTTYSMTIEKHGHQAMLQADLAQQKPVPGSLLTARRI
jgi:hypothetical protein